MTYPIELAGRLMTYSQLSEEERQAATPIDSFQVKNGSYFCQRCQAKTCSDILPTGYRYCRQCLLYGRNTSQHPLYAFPQQTFPKMSALTWSGQLTPFQEEVSQALIEAYNKKEPILVKAVTGAGKTEMIYQLVNKVVSEGGCVGLVSPRVDVCRELYQRLQKDFSCPICLQYGDSDPYERTPLLIATTHQLPKFYQAFDLLIIDEVDAFPFVDNAFLYQGVANALKPDGVKVFLTATSTDALDRQVKQGQLKEVHLARRFHANPLVVPRPIWLSGLEKAVSNNRLPGRLLNYLTQQRQTEFPLLIFFPDIEGGQAFSQVLQGLFPEEKVGFVSSQTEERKELVQSFRDREITILVATTILERGVTFPGVDVFVLDAGHYLYTRSSLIQIAGRVGRSAQRPTGQLLFFHDGLSRAIKTAIQSIRVMNQKGGFG